MHFKLTSIYLILKADISKTWSDRYRQNISIGITLDLSIPTEMTSIEPLVENAKSSKTPRKLKIMLCFIFSD